MINLTKMQKGLRAIGGHGEKSELYVSKEEIAGKNGARPAKNGSDIGV